MTKNMSETKKIADQILINAVDFVSRKRHGCVHDFRLYPDMPNEKMENALFDTLVEMGVIEEVTTCRNWVLKRGLIHE